MDLEAAQAAVERACEEFKVPATAAAASAVLLQFRSSPGVLGACRHILDRSHSIDARFHAAAALRESVVRDWAALGPGPEGRTALRRYLLGYLAAAAEQPALQVVRSSLISALAVLLKRGWLEPGEGPASRAAFFQELEAATSQSAAARRVGVQVLEAVVGEFAVSSASPLGLPLEHHAKCAADMQDHYLQGIFRHADPTRPYLLLSFHRALLALAAAHPPRLIQGAGDDVVAAASGGLHAGGGFLALLQTWALMVQRDCGGGGLNPGLALSLAVCTVLLPVLSRRRPLCACLLEASPSWAELCWAFAARRPQLAAGLAPKLQRWLSQSLCQAACGFPSADSPQPLATSPAGAYIANLLGPTAAELAAAVVEHHVGYLQDAAADAARELRALLSLLTHITQRDVALAAAASDGWASSAGSTPHSVTMAGGGVVALPPPHFATLLSCLEAGARGAAPQQGRNGSGAGAGTSGSSGTGSTPATFDGVVVQSALEGLAGLAKYHHQSVMNGGRGFAGQCAPGDAGPDVVEQAGDALLPLLQSDPAAFASLGQALVQSSDPRVAGQLLLTCQASHCMVVVFQKVLGAQEWLMFCTQEKTVSPVSAMFACMAGNQPNKHHQ
eukprot:XP_001695243.1 predicted protein [Chlamydomonas reinhardtii]